MAIYLCHDEPDLYVHDASVVDSRPGAVALSRSAFHPGGGGQVSDVGSIEWSGGRLAVTHIEPEGEIWWHVLADPVAELSGDVTVAVDAEHRLRVASLHTMSHVLNAFVFDLHDYPGTVVAVTHDRYFLDNVAGWILELDRGRGIPWEGNYSSWLEQKEARLATEQKQEKARHRAMQSELEWVRSNAKGRHAKSRSRLNRFEELNSKEFQTRNETREIYIPPGPRLGDLVIEAEALSKSYGEQLLFDDMTFSLPPGGIVGVIGPNGAGKTTLFRMITDATKPDSGTLRLGDSVTLAYVDQSRDSLDDTKTVWEEISDGLDMITVGTYETPSRGYCGRFNFRGGTQQQKIGSLSGGERNRVHLAKLLRAGGNVLLLDEPTNDLDVETLRALEEAMLAFPGCVVVISHDRWFLDRIATHILAFEGDSQVTWFEGNYADYEKDRKRRLGKSADQPHRIRYKRLA